MKLRTALIAIILFVSQFVDANAQQKQLPSFAPSRDQMLKRYIAADERDSLARRTIFRSSVQPGWSGPSSFWYRNALPDSQSEYIFVDPIKATKRQVFDGVKMANALAEATNKPVTAGRLPIKDLYVYPDGTKLAIATGTDFYQVDLSNYSFAKIDTLPTDKTIYPGLTKPVSRWQRGRQEKQSPDKKWATVIKENNIYLEPQDGGNPIAYTTDGTATMPYSDITWSPDNGYLIAYKIKRVIDKPVYYIATSLPGTSRGELKQQNYKQPGDEFSTYEMYIIKIADRSVTKVQTGIIDFFDAPKLRWNNGDNDHFMYERVDRGHQRFRIVEVNAQDGATRNIVDEQTNTFIYEQRIVTHYLAATAEIIWVTEKDGWRHIYLVDAKKGLVKNPITKGGWVVRAIDSIDVSKREIWFQASGMNAGEDPYHIHYYRIGFDGKNLVTLTKPGYNHRLQYSPDKQYFFDTYSTVNRPTESIVCRTSDGKKIMDIEKTDISRYTAAGFVLPEVFHAKGRDGVTEIWGVVIRPSDFDPSKKYPIIENIYAGPQDSFVPKNFSPFGEMQSMAELGFIVVQIDGMGTANRSKAFHDVCWKNLADAGFPDRIAWMRALANSYPQADTSRVGLYGTSAGGQNSLGGLLFHSEWYKAAYSACGCHDNRVDKQWWNEQWMGYPVGKHYDEQSNITNAYKLKGKLMLVVGEADQNVPPESTYRVVDALIKAKKTFDFLAFPGMGHSDGGPYGRMKKRDFFVKSLLGIDPPDRNNNELMLEEQKKEDNNYPDYSKTLLLEAKTDTSANVSFGDFDGDGHLDILLVKGRHWPIIDGVLLGDGIGGIRKSYDLGEISDRSYTGGVADFNGDGFLDIAVSNDAPNKKLVYFNDGKGNFVIGSEFGQPKWPTRNLSIADINKDGLPDLILANRGGVSNYICLNMGKGKFNNDGISFAPYPSTTITPADLNNDGFIDLVVPHRNGGQSYIYLGRSDFIYSDNHRLPFGPPDAKIRMASVADFNSDNILDIVVIDESKGVNLYIGQKDQTFSLSTTLGDSKIVPYALTIADMNKDNKVDIIVGHVNAPSTVFFNDGTGNFKAISFGDSSGTVYGFAVGDFNNDGIPDIATARSEATNILHFGNLK